jgi:hypothetical protein
MKVRQRTIGIIIIISYHLSLASFALGGQAYTWVAGNGKWSAASNWSPNTGPPGAADDQVLIGGGATVYLDDCNSGANRIRLTGGSKLIVGHNQFYYSLSLANPGAMLELDGSSELRLDHGSLNAPGAATLSGSGQVTLINGGITSFSGNITNQTLITGGGGISAFIYNQGGIFANGQTIIVTGAIDNSLGTMSAGGSGVLELRNQVVGGHLNPNDGLIRLAGGYGPVILENPTFGPGKVELDRATLQNPTFGATQVELTGNNVMQGIINLGPGTEVLVNSGFGLTLEAYKTPDINPVYIYPVVTGGTFRLDNSGISSGKATLSSTTRIILGGPAGPGGIDSFSGTITNEGTIEGRGSVSAVLNQGSILANDQLLRVRSIEGNGAITVSGGATLEIQDTNLQAGNLVMSEDAAWIVYWGRTVDLKGNFTFHQQDVSKWSWPSVATLQMSGGGTLGDQSLEIGGKDFGLDESGFAGNFNLPSLALAGAGTYVYLADAIDNGHRSSPEALYVNSLSVPIGTTLNLNNLHLYTHYAGSAYRVVAGDGSKFGGGQIIDVSVNPGPSAIPGIIAPLLLN